MSYTKKIIRDLAVLLLLFGAVLTFFLVNPVVPDMNFHLLSVEKEEQLGDWIVESLQSSDSDFSKLEDPLVDSAIQVISDRLVEAVGASQYTHKISVVRSRQVNAVTLPGGYIFVFQGLLDLSESPEEVAAVIAHELGHVEQRHIVNKLMKEFTLSAIMMVLTGGNGGVITQMGKTVLSTSFDRHQESEADYFGLKLMERANIDPVALASFFERMKKEKGSYSKGLELVMTHPHTDTRIKMAREYDLPEGFEPVAFELDWGKVKERVKSGLEFFGGTSSDRDN